MCHSCVSRNSGYFVPASVFLGKRELWDTFWTAAFVGMSPAAVFPSLHWRLEHRGRSEWLPRLKSTEAR
jgi:hypothetical protein